MGRNKVLMINHYAGAPAYGMRFRDYDIARELITLGYEVCIVAASFSHLRKTPSVKNEIIDGIHYCWIKVPKYKSYGLSRFINMAMFPINAILRSGDIPFKPNFIIASSPSPFTVLCGIYFKKKFKSKFIYEIRDVWPKSIIELKNKSETHPLMKLIDKIDFLGIKNADLILSPLSNIELYIHEKGFDKKVLIIPNGISDIELPHNSNTENSGKFVIGYGGSLSDSNSIMNLLEAAVILKNNNNIVFKIVGSGERYFDIEKLMKKEKLDNVLLYGQVGKNEFFNRMLECDTLYKGNPKKEIYNYGVSSIKMAEYLLLKKPVLDASFGVDIIQKSGAGIVIEPENSKKLAEGILKLKSLKEKERTLMGERGYNFAIENFLYKNTVKRLKYHLVSE